MDEYLDLNRRFGLLTKYTPDELLVSNVGGKSLGWDEVLGGQFSIIVGRANFGKTMELKAKTKLLRSKGKCAVYIALHTILGENDFDDALGAEDREALVAWKRSAGELTIFVDSLDEASLGTEAGVRKSVRRLSKMVGWPDADIKWVFSSRPAVLTDAILEFLQLELSTTLFRGSRKAESSGEEFDSAFAELGEASQHDDEGDSEQSSGDDSLAVEPSIGDVGATDAMSKTIHSAPAHEQLKVYALLPLDKLGAVLYLGSHLGVSEPKQTLSAASQYGLGKLAEGPGGLDILAYIDPVTNPPQCLTQVFEKMVEAVQQQQRSDPRERRLGNPPPGNLKEAIERLASASVICSLPNIELSPKALRYRDGVMSAQPIIASILSEDSQAYLLGSRLFIDSGQHQVKLYPDELLPFLAAKRLASLVKSPDHARRLLANFTWHATTGECGVYRALLPLAGWLSVFCVHSRKELLEVEPQAVAFFGDLRNPQVPLTDASIALERTIERLVTAGDSLGRSHYTPTAENFWQAAKPGLEPTLLRIFNKFSADWHAKDALFDIAENAGLSVFRDPVLDSCGRDYSKLIEDQIGLNYILTLASEDDLLALGTEVRKGLQMSESRAARLVSALAWKALDARSIAAIAADQFRQGRGGFSIDWALTRNVAAEATDVELYRLTRSLLWRLVNKKACLGRAADRYWADQKFVELVMDLLALVIDRAGVKPVQAATLCLVLNRYVSKHHSSADVRKLHLALRANKAVRLQFLRGLIESTDKTPDEIAKQVLWSSFYPRVEGDEFELGEPGFTDLVAKLKTNAATPPVPPTHRKKGWIVDKKSKKILLGELEEIQNATNDNALVWVAQWLNHTVEHSHYSECNFALFEKEAGAQISLGVRKGLSNLWRNRDPIWNEAEPNSTFYITIAGLQGLHLDLGDGTILPAIDDEEVPRAMRYAQFELNGYPKWFWKLVGAHAVTATQALRSIMAEAKNGQVSRDKAERLILHLEDAPEAVRLSLSRDVWEYILDNPKLGDYAAAAALKAVTASTGIIDIATFEAEAWRRMASAFNVEIPELTEPPAATDIESTKARQAFEKQVQELRLNRSTAVVWARFWLLNYPRSFRQAWESWQASSAHAAQNFMLALAANLGDDRGVGLNQVAEKGSEGLDTLKMLYKWVHLIVDEKDDIKHDDGRVYSIGERDKAQHLRDALVPAIAHAKSEKAYEVLDELRLQASGLRNKYLRRVQFMMREEQNARTPVPQTDYFEFERSFAPPVSDYLSFAMAVESDLLTVKSEIETGDFSLRRFFNSLTFDRIKTDNEGLALEEDFQALLGSELNHAAGSRYVVTLEPILPEGTRRDVLCQTGSFRATVELKMSLRWSLPQYVEALEEQLQGQYMMAPNSKIGFFVIVLQEERTWEGPDGPIIFDELLEILRSKARQKESADSSVYLRVIGIDATVKEDFRAAKSSAKTPALATGMEYADGAGNTWSGRGRRPKWITNALTSGKTLGDFVATKPGN